MRLLPLVPILLAAACQKSPMTRVDTSPATAASADPGSLRTATFALG